MRKGLAIICFLLLAGAVYASVYFTPLTTQCPPGVLCAQVLTRSPLPFLLATLITILYAGWLIEYLRADIGQNILKWRIALWCLLLIIGFALFKGWWWSFVVYGSF